MPVVNNKIVAPVNPWVVSKLIGMGSVGDVAKVCSAGEPYINIWSKYKPVRNPKVTDLTDQEFEYQTIENTRYGIKPVSVTDTNPISLYTSIVANSNKGFIYNKPNGGANSAYRIIDFVGYNHKAEFPITDIGINNTTIELSENGVMGFYIDWTTINRNAEINPLVWYDGFSTNVYNNSQFLGALITELDGRMIGWSVGNEGTYDDKGNPIDIPYDTVKLTPGQYFNDREVLITFFIASTTLEGNWRTGDYSHNIIFKSLPTNFNNPNPVKVMLKRYEKPLPDHSIYWEAGIVESGNKVEITVFVRVSVHRGQTYTIPAQKMYINIYKQASGIGGILYGLSYNVPAVTGTISADGIYEERFREDFPIEEVGKAEAIYNGEKRQI